MGTQAAPGRPRSAAKRRAVLDAALELCRRDGYAELTMKGIADAAGVGRQTVYRWWPAKTDVLIEALADIAARTLPTLPRTGDPYADLHAVLLHTFHVLNETSGPPLAGLMADAQHDAALGRRLQGTLLGPRRAYVRDLLTDAAAAGRLTLAVEPALVADLLFGTMWYRLLGGHAPVDDALAADLVDVVRRLLAPA